MLFSSSVFLFLFLPVVLLVYYLPLRRWRQGQNVFLLLASLGFYAWGEPWFVLVMLGSILANYGFGLWVDACKRAGRTCAPPLVTALAVNLGILFVFKYLTFTLGILNRLGAAFVIPGIELPIGISFFTFQALSYVLDVHRDALVGEDGTVYKAVTRIDGVDTAQVMLVVGTDGGGAQHPYWIDNLALAVRFQQELVSDYVSLARPIVLRNSSYNQQLSPGYLLVEVGGHGNTLTEAVDGARLFAQSVSQVLNTMWVK